MSISDNRPEQLIAAAEDLVAAGIPVLPIKPRAKTPIPNPTDGSWWVIDEPDEVGPAFANLREANLGILCGRAKGSPVLSVDCDGPTGLAKARELGVNSGADCWVQRTGRGGYQVIYYAEPGLELPRRVKAGGVDLDLLVDGYALVPPSITTGPYRWLPGHGPDDIPLADLAPPPAQLVEWWQTGQGEQSTLKPAAVSNPAFSLLGEPIPEGKRNDTLCKIAGWLRLYHPEPVVAALLLCVNESRCTPPLPQSEVEAIANSVCKYPQPGVNGHPPAVVPSFRRGASDA